MYSIKNTWMNHSIALMEIFIYCDEHMSLMLTADLTCIVESPQMLTGAPNMYSFRLNIMYAQVSPRGYTYFIPFYDPTKQVSYCSRALDHSFLLFAMKYDAYLESDSQFSKLINETICIWQTNQSKTWAFDSYRKGI